MCVCYREVCCRSLYCITLYTFVQGNINKTTQISICTYLQRWEEVKGVVGRWSQSKDCRKKKVPLLLLKLLLACLFFLFSKCSSSPLLLLLFVSFLLIVALAVPSAARNIRSEQTCVRCRQTVCIAAKCIVCDAANYSALLRVFGWFTKGTEFHALDAMDAKESIGFSYFFCLYI